MTSRLIKSQSHPVESGFIEGIEEEEFIYLKEILRCINLNLCILKLSSDIEELKNSVVNKFDILDVLQNKGVTVILEENSIKLNYSIDDLTDPSDSELNQSLTDCLDEEYTKRYILNDNIIELILTLFYEIQFLHFNQKQFILHRSFWTADDLRFQLSSGEILKRGFYPRIPYNHRRKLLRQRANILESNFQKLLDFLNNLENIEKKSFSILSQLHELIQKVIKKSI